MPEHKKYKELNDSDEERDPYFKLGEIRFKCYATGLDKFFLGHMRDDLLNNY